MRLPAVGFILVALLVGSTCAEEEVKPKPDRTLFGVVFRGKVYAASGRTALVIGDLQETPVIARRWELQGDSDEMRFPPRWRISPSGKAMMLDAPTWRPPERFRWGGLFDVFYYPVAKAFDHKYPEFTGAPGPAQERYAVMQFCPQSQQNVLDAVFDSFANHFEWKYEGKEERKDEDFFFSQYEFFYDFVPHSGEVTDYSLFLLANGKLQEALDRDGRAEAKMPLPENTTRKLPLGLSSQSEVFKGPATSALGVWAPNKDEKTKDMQWVLECTIPVPFHERFHAFVKGTTYFFLTDSGKVYMARKPDKGERKLESLWDNDKSPIVAALHDADADKVYLFSKAAKDDRIGTDFYWELDETVKRVDYEPSRVHPVKTVEPLKTVMELAQLLVDEKKVKVEKK